LLHLYDLLIYVLQRDREEIRFSGSLPSYKIELIKFLSFQRQMWLKLRSIQLQKPPEFESDERQGHLVQFGCGHRGQPSRIEEKRVSRLMRASGFIPQLEDLKQQRQINASGDEEKANKDESNLLRVVEDSQRGALNQRVGGFKGMNAH
jgi:hypothetical protein